jgi:hypothetical protein
MGFVFVIAAVVLALIGHPGLALLALLCAGSAKD